MNISEQLLTPNEYSRPGTLLQGVKGIVIHYTGNPGASAQGNRNYFDSLKNQPPDSSGIYASAHYVVGLEGEIIRCLPDTEIGYHVGARQYTPEALQRLSSYPNDCTIGIELCIDKTGSFNTAVLASGQELARMLRETYGLNRDDLWRHYDITGKICPKPFVDNLHAWEDFKASC
ncbi:MAG: N-acetylmuramoyl-L-alanine amidase [Spirochaetaceae bacterium]|jgi:N-acetylmuramoyl-L-alanine amidase|nr:N-acetylmuramoyl-L-alanine amidase [Spirochaetaceae bacterium]